MIKYTDILDRIRQNDPAAMELLYIQYGQRFYSYCVEKWHCDEDDAWDIVYRTLETLLLKLDRYHFESQENFNGMLYRVLMNFIRMHYRASQAKKELVYEVVDFNEERIPKEVEERLSDTTLRRYYEDEIVDAPTMLLLREALTKLDKEDSEILLLRSQNYSYEEIAGFLEIDDPHLKVKYHRAKKKLIQLMTSKQTKEQEHENNG